MPLSVGQHHVPHLTLVTNGGFEPHSCALTLEQKMCVYCQDDHLEDRYEDQRLRNTEESFYAYNGGQFTIEPANSFTKPHGYTERALSDVNCFSPSPVSRRSEKCA